MKYSLLLLLVCLSLITQCQTTAIQKTYAFMREELPGNIPVDINGEPVKRMADTTNLVYLETKGPVLDYKVAWIRNKAYTVTLVPVKQTSVAIGKMMSSEKNVVITPKAGNDLWQVMFEPIKATGKRPIIKGVGANDIILEGQYKNRKLYYTIKNRVLLRPLLAV